MEYTSTDKRTDGPDRAAARLRAATGMQSAGDARWLRYARLLQLARAHKLTVFGIDLPLALRRRVSRVGISGLTPVERSVLPNVDTDGGTGTADPAYRDLMLARLKAAHCGHGDTAYLQRLFENWQARNETMARTITAAASARGNSPVVVIVGGGHVRGGEGVVPRVEKLIPRARQLIVSFTEVDESRADAARYLSRAHATVGQPSASEELLWFTTRHGLTMDEACKSFRDGKHKAG